MSATEPQVQGGQQQQALGPSLQEAQAQAQAQGGQVQQPQPAKEHGGIDLSDLALPVVAFYLIVFCNFTKETLGCRLQELLDSSMVAKHAVGFILLLFLVVMVSPTNADRTLPRSVGLAAAAYLMFLMTTRTPLLVMVAVLLMLFAVYVLGATKDRYEREHQEHAAKRVKVAQTALTIAAFLVSLIGCALYFVEKRREYGADFTLAKFIVGTTTCRRFTPAGASVVRLRRRG